MTVASQGDIGHVRSVRYSGLPGPIAGVPGQLRNQRLVLPSDARAGSPLSRSDKRLSSIRHPEPWRCRTRRRGAFTKCGRPTGAEFGPQAVSYLSELDCHRLGELVGVVAGFSSCGA